MRSWKPGPTKSHRVKTSVDCRRIAGPQRASCEPWADKRRYYAEKSCHCIVSNVSDECSESKSGETAQCLWRGCWSPVLTERGVAAENTTFTLWLTASMEFVSHIPDIVILISIPVGKVTTANSRWFTYGGRSLVHVTLSLDRSSIRVLCTVNRRVNERLILTADVVNRSREVQRCETLTVEVDDRK